MASKPHQLVMRTGPNPGQAYQIFKSEIFIGRDVSNDIVIQDSEVSRKHARIIMQGGGYVLEDLGSTNGTFVNGQRLMGPHMLRPGEMVMFGENVSLVFETGYDPDATMMSAAPVPSTYAPPPRQQAYTPAPQPATTPPPKPYYEATPVTPEEPYYGPEPGKWWENRTLIIGGCGCLLVLLCVFVGGALVFDTLNLYCEPPFDILSPMIWVCP